MRALLSLSSSASRSDRQNDLDGGRNALAITRSRIGTRWGAFAPAASGYDRSHAGLGQDRPPCHLGFDEIVLRRLPQGRSGDARQEPGYLLVLYERTDGEGLESNIEEGYCKEVVLGDRVPGFSPSASTVAPANGSL